jgi:hypothetical protein
MLAAPRRPAEAGVQREEGFCWSDRESPRAMARRPPGRDGRGTPSSVIWRLVASWIRPRGVTPKPAREDYLGHRSTSMIVTNGDFLGSCLTEMSPSRCRASRAAYFALRETPSLATRGFVSLIGRPGACPPRSGSPRRRLGGTCLEASPPSPATSWGSGLGGTARGSEVPVGSRQAVGWRIGAWRRSQGSGGRLGVNAWLADSK